MKRQYVLATLGLICLLVSPGWAQSTKEQVEELRRQIQLLEGKLQQLDSGTGGDRRVTQLGGGTRLRPREPETVVRIYDLGDLFAMAPPYEARRPSDLTADERLLFPSVISGEIKGGFGGMGGGGFFNVKDKPAKLPDPPQTVLHQQFAGVSTGDVRSSIEDLIEAITSTISPTEWQEVGGPASIASIGHSLLISADEQTHEQVDALLNLFRKRWGTLRTVSVRARWLWLTDSQLQPLLAVAQKPTSKEDEVPAFGLVDEAAWNKLLEADGQQRAGYQAVLTCYNGQTVHALSGGQSLAVTGMIPVVGGGEGGPESVGYQPQVSVIQEGAALQITPIVNVSGKFVLLDVHSRVVERDDPVQAAATPAGLQAAALRSPVEQLVAAIDRPVLLTHRFSTTLRIPVDRCMLVGGMTYESVPEPGGANLYLFLEVSVQELRDDQTQPKSDAPPKPKPEEKAKKKQ